MADDSKPNAASLALLNAQMDSLAREIGALNPRCLTSVGAVAYGRSEICHMGPKLIEGA